MRLALLLLGLALSTSVQATQVYVSKGAHGEVSFSDTRPQEGPVQVVEIETVTPRDPPQDAAERTQAMWAFALEMEKSRLAREAARAERRKQAAQTPPRVVVTRPEEPRYVVGWPYRPHRPWRPPHVRPKPLPSPREPVRSSPLPTPQTVASPRSASWR